MCTELMNVIHLYLILARYLAAPLLMFSSYIKKKKSANRSIHLYAHQLKLQFF